MKRTLDSGEPSKRQKMLLEEKNPFDRDDRCVFLDQDEQGNKIHVYKIDGQERGIINGQEYDIKSVSHFTHFGFEQFDEDKNITEMMSDDNWPRNKYYGKTREQIKALWEYTRNAASERGTYVHLQIELYYNGLPYDKEAPEMLLFFGFVAANGNLTIYRTELNLFCKQLLICGQADALFRNDKGEFEIGDWKCSKEIRSSGFCRCLRARSSHLPNCVGNCECLKKPTKHKDDCPAYGNHPLTKKLPNCNKTYYGIQLNLYRWLLKRFYGIEAKRLFLVVLHADQETFLRYDIRIDEAIAEGILLERCAELGLPRDLSLITD